MKVKCETCDGTGMRDNSRSYGRSFTRCEDCNRTGFIDDGRPDYLEYDEYKAGLRAVLANPADDLPRLVLADWIEEHGRDSERAGHIRFSIQDWIEMTRPGHPGPEPEGQSLMALREDGSFMKVTAIEGGSQDVGGRVVGWGIETRGFISEVRCTLAAFVGENCGVCDGMGLHHFRRNRCRCNGTGNIAGHAKALFEANPITKVVLTDREPFVSRGSRSARPDYFIWQHSEMEGADGRQILPVEVFDSLEGYIPLGIHWKQTTGRYSDHCYLNREDAVSALSAALVRYGRSLAFPDEIPAILSDGTPVSIPAGEAPSF